MAGNASNPFDFDLNEPPSYPERLLSATSALSLVRDRHQPDGSRADAAAYAEAELAAGIVTGARFRCKICLELESSGPTVVCDGCEVGFHVECLKEEGEVVETGAEWRCWECVRGRVRVGQKRLRVGPTEGLIDVNVAVMEEEEEEEEEREGGGEGGAMEERGGAGNGGEGGDAIGRLGNPEESSRSREELYLSTLREFISEKGGFLGVGWHVECRQPQHPNNPEPFALYCAPDGKKFDSMHDVADSLGISPGSMKGLPSRRRRQKDLARSSAACKPENRDTRKINKEEVLSSVMEVPDDDYLNLSVGLPIQYEDFFVLCLGKIDVRAAYHDSHHIWPIGYRSNWHDKVTGSLFQCEVSDGGNSGPIFKVRRRPCSLFPFLNGETIIIHNKAKRVEPVGLGSSNLIFDASPNEEDDISVHFSGPNASEQDLSYCFGHADAQMDINMPDTLSALLNECSRLKDTIGEFYVEGRSSSSAWKMVSKTLIAQCQEVYRKSGCLKFSCGHECGSSSSVGETVKDAPHKGLARFCYASRSINLPSVILSNTELDASCRSLAEWIEQDRFGLDVGFVQEMIETLPASRACSQYHFLTERKDFPLWFTVGSGLLLPEQKNEERNDGEVSQGLYSGKNAFRQQDLPEKSPIADRRTPPGQPLSSKLPGELMGDIYQISEFLWRFYTILGLKDPFSYEELEGELLNPWPCDLIQRKNEKDKQDSRDKASPVTESANSQVPSSVGVSVSDAIDNVHNPFKLIPVETAVTREASQGEVASHTYNRCCGVVLTKVHASLLKVLVGELLNKVAVFLDPKFDCRESKSKRGRKKDTANSSSIMEQKNELLTINELTWPELARRYVLAALLMKGRMESQDACRRESLKLFRCLQGDGGVLVGALSGVAGMEADALVLTEAGKQISDSTEQVNDVLSLDCTDPEVEGACEPAVDAGNNLPEWAQVLEPVRKLPTNVGARIRRCVYSALEKNPPDWAKKRLEQSISKGVYKGNAAGPTKRAVVSILADVTNNPQQLQQKPKKAQIERGPLKLSDLIMRKCRGVLRSAVSAEESRTFCNLLGTGLLNSYDNNEKGILGSPAMVSRPLDFRTIDLRLAVGAYGGSHETFLEDVREVWRNLCTAYGDQPNIVQKLEILSQNFESLYEKEVLPLQKFVEHSHTERLDADKQKELILLVGRELPRAPWEQGICKVCGIDKDDTSVLLCDNCNSEYHRYCLNPPLARIPEGDWFCPSCVSNQGNVRGKSKHTEAVASHPREQPGGGHVFQDMLQQLATSMDGKDYWELRIEERIFLLKFLCDEVLNSAVFREHIDQCADKSNHAQQIFFALIIEWRNLKSKEESLVKTGKEHTIRSTGTGDLLREEAGTVQFINKDTFPTKVSASPLKRGCTFSAACNEDNRQKEVNQNIDLLLKGLFEKHANVNIPQTLLNQIVAATGVHIGNGHVTEGDELNRQERSSEMLEIPSTRRNGVVQSNTHTSNGSWHTSEFEASNNALNSLTNEISQLQDSIARVETQIMLWSMRRNMLGRDSMGRSYWVISRPGRRPWYIVEGSTCDLALTSSVTSLTSLVLYESDTEIQQLLHWLRDNDPRERELKECILLWQRLASYLDNIYESYPKSSVGASLVAPHCLTTKAFALLENRYGPCLEEEVSEMPKKGGRKTKVTDEERMYRCDCLELVWPSRYHCLSCHQTFCSINYLEGHNDGKCPADESKENDDQMKGKGSAIVKENFGDVDTAETSGKVKLYELEEISKTFITKDSNRELVKQIGLIGSEGVPSLITSPPTFFDPPLILKRCRKSNDQLQNSAQCDGSNAFLGVVGNKGYNLAKSLVECNSVGDHPFFQLKSSKVSPTCRIPGQSCNPLIGKASHIIKRLKIYLLDMEAALPEEALRPLTSHSLRRCAWRAFVKSAESIFEMVQATVLLEDMIKTDYLRTGWWYWSSLTAAAKTSTLSSLALRIFTLDDSIIYMKEDLQTTNSIDPLVESRAQN